MPGSAPDASFVSADRQALAARVRVVEVVPRPGWGQLGFAAAVARRLLADRPARAVVWFASPTYGALTAAACRLAGVPLLVVSGGMDVASCPEIGFGDARGGWRRALGRRVLEGASLVWAFSESARREIEARARPRAVAIVPPAVDTAFYQPPAVPAARERLIVSTCAAITATTIVQKGVDRLVAAARELDGVQVVVTGRLDDADPAVRALVAGAPPHVAFAGHVPREALRALYARAAVVAQLSRHEGFGVAVAEAAAMGCALVTTRLGVFGEVVGGGGAHLQVPLDASDAAIAATLRDALDAAPAAPRWADIDRRFGPAVRAAAWDAWLAAEGLA